ncbi:hypothetical protein D3C87_109000 [compost metagenome]
MKFRITTCILALLLSSCVSVKLGGSKVTSAKDVKFDAPSSPYKEIKAPNSDKAWISGKTGNTISYLSECGGTLDLSLTQIESDSLTVMNKLEVLKAEVTQFNGREAHKSIASGEVDGVPVQISLVVFKKNNCNYTLSYGGVQRQFAAEEQIFNRFVDSFKAP